MEVNGRLPGGGGFFVRYIKNHKQWPLYAAGSVLSSSQGLAHLFPTTTPCWLSSVILFIGEKTEAPGSQIAWPGLLVLASSQAKV